eukprot:scaffold5428_cov150-Skeletonema_menzelii.AAC.2
MTMPRNNATNTDTDTVMTFTIPTKQTDEAPKRVIDTSNLSDEDLEALKKQDPFLYYSIPGDL